MNFTTRLFKRIFQFKIYRRLILSFVLMLVLTVSVLCFVLFYLFSKSTGEEIADNSKQMLTQTSYASDVIYEQTVYISTQLMNNNSIITFLNSDDVDKILCFRISKELTNIRNVYPFISSIGIYNLQSGSSFDTDDIPIDMSLLNKNEKKYIEIFPRQVVKRYYNRQIPYYLLTFVIYPEFSLSKSTYSAIVINIDQKYILNTVSSITGVQPGTDTFVIDSEGLIVSHFENSRFMADISSDEYIQDILKDNKNTGSFITGIKNEKYLVTYAKSDIVDWYFVNIKRYDQLLGNLFWLRNTILLISIVLIMVGITLSFIVSGFIYNPIRSLMYKVSKINKDIAVQKYDEYRYLTEVFTRTAESARLLSSSVEKASFIIREDYLKGLLKGNLGQINLSKLMLDKTGKGFDSPYYLIIVFKIDDFQNLKRNIKANEQHLFNFIVGNISHELLLRHFRNETATCEDDELAVLALMSDNKLTDEIYLTLSEIQDAVSKYYSFTVSVYVGNVLNSIDDISESYATILEYSKYSLFCGRECIINSERYEKLAMRSGIYPADIEKKLLAALRLCDMKEVKVCINSFIDYINRINYYEAINYSNHIISSVIKSYTGFFDGQDIDFKHYLDNDLVSKAYTVQDIKDIISDLCTKICICAQEKKNCQNNKRHEKIVNEVKSYLKDYYTDPNLSLELAAHKVNLSPGYLGKIFKNYTSLSFSDYLNNLRLEKAKVLLSTTNEPASRICEKVGIYNITYFSTLFKKTYGMTPSQFRED